jgi:AcrR family transcriptional regulator
LREDLIEAVFWRLEHEARVDAVSIREVARRAGVAHQSVYLRLLGITQLLRAAYDRLFTDPEKVLKGQDQGPKAPPARLLNLCLACGDFGLKHPATYLAMLGARSPPQSAWDRKNLPELAVFARLDKAVAEYLGPSHQPRDANLATTYLRDSLPGPVSPRITKPSPSHGPDLRRLGFGHGAIESQQEDQPVSPRKSGPRIQRVPQRPEAIATGGTRPNAKLGVASRADLGP